MHRRISEETHPEQNSNTSKYHCCRRERLKNRYCRSGIEKKQRLTRPISAPAVAENVNRMLTIGVNDLIRLSSPLRNLSRACACFRNTAKMESGELLLLSSSEANGCVRRSCPVRVLYLFDAASNIAVKLVAEGLVVWLVVDIWKSQWESKPTEGALDSQHGLWI